MRNCATSWTAFVPSGNAELGGGGMPASPRVGTMAYPLRTERLILDPLVEADVPEFVAYRQDPDVARWQSWTPDFDRADALRLIAGQPDTDLPAPGGWIQLAIRPKDRTNVLGDVAIHRVPDQPDTFEIGVTLSGASQGRGLAAEALTAVLKYLFTDAHAHRVVAQCDARNDQVARLLRRLGFRHESSQVDADYFKGEWTTLDGYAMLAREYRAVR